MGYRATGTLLVGFDRDDVAALSDLHAFQAELGLEVEQLRSREARAREPMLSPRVRVGLLAAEDHRVEPRACVAALLRACADAGVVLDHRKVARIEQQRGRVTGVLTADGERHHAGQVVLSAGAWSATIEGLPDADRPAVRPVKGQLLHLRDPSGQQVLTTTVRGLVRHRSVYLVPRDDGRLVVGASQEERGFDTTVTAGAVRELLDDAAAIVPGVDELELVETIAGLRPTTPDNAPVIGPGPIDGLVVATGHHRNGVLLAPITAEAVAAILTGAEVDPVLAVAHPGPSRSTDVNLELNGQPRSFDGPVTVGAVVDGEVGDRRGVAVAVDGEVLPRSSWDTTTLDDGAKVELVGAVQGG